MPASGAPSQPYDVFVCHASEDKAGFVEPLVAALTALGLAVWYDRFEIRLGDDFRSKMDEGLRSSRFGVVVVSPRSDKYWTNAELSALFNLEALAAHVGTGDTTRILPVRLDLTVAEVAARSPLLAARMSIGSELGIDELARQIADRVRRVTPSPMPRSPLYNLPSRRARAFVGRDDDLARLDALLAPGRRVGLAPAASIEGLAGIGKTELALQAAYRLSLTDRFPRGIVWLDAEQPDLVPQWGGPVADALAIEAGPIADRAQSAVRALSNAGPVLVILDNVTSWTVTTSPRPLPNGSTIALLVTTRERKLAGQGFEHVAVERLPRDAAGELVCTLAGRDLRPEPGFDDLLTHLDGHALALELAGAFLSEPTESPATYLARLRRGEPVEKTVSDQTRYERTVHQAFDANVERLDPAARSALRVASWFADAEASVELLRACGVGELEFRALRRYHLLWGDGERWSMHRLVRAYGRRQGTDEENAAARRTFVEGCAERAEGIDLATGVRIYRADRPHFDHAVDLAEMALADDPARLRELLGRVGTGAYSSGDLPRARDLLEQALACGLRFLGEDHPDVATRRSDLALVLKDLGDIEGARNLLEHALASGLRHLGEDHPHVAIWRSNLAGALRSVGDLPGARDLLEQALASGLRHLGENHPSIAIRRAKLASVLKALGDLRGARELLEQALASDLRSLGEDHRNVAVWRFNLAGLCDKEGDLVAARDLFAAALAIEERTLGPDHPSTAVTRARLADAKHRLGDDAGARADIQRALDVVRGQPAGSIYRAEVELVAAALDVA